MLDVKFCRFALVYVIFPFLRFKLELKRKANVLNLRVLNHG